MLTKPLSYGEMEIIRSHFGETFKSNQPFGQMFQHDVTSRLLIYPTDGTYLDEQQFIALIESIKAIGESGFYISEVEAEPDPFVLPNNNEMYHPAHWICDFPITIDEYRDLTIVLDNALFSKNGKWGMLISNEGHAVLGGTNEFINHFKRLYPSWVNCFTEFEKMCEYNRNKYNTNMHWYDDFVKHIFN
ncbi:hypothetical protein [Cohnella soli]|uniref:SMI1/KNR4 family protein n=1 Tax=Cohnella soli TaxID=425005 RepID=A0ABW0HT59_9BACL